MIDLTKLPEPDLIAGDGHDALYDRLVSTFLERWEAARQVNPALPAFNVETLETDPAAVVLQATAYRMMLLRRAVNDAARQTMVAYADGVNLDHLAANVGLVRFDHETDDALRVRVTEALELPSTAGSRRGYIAAAKNASGDIKSVGISEPVGPRIALYIQAQSGIASPDLLALVQEAVNAEDVRPMNDKPVALPAHEVPFALETVLHLYPGADAQTVTALADERGRAYAADRHLIAHDITRSGLIAALSVEGVRNVDLGEPAADLIMDETGFPVLSDVTLRVDAVRDV